MTEHQGEQVVEVVGHAAGHAADALHLLRVHQLVALALVFAHLQLQAIARARQCVAALLRQRQVGAQTGQGLV